jgi:hypothetical protein
VSVSLAGVGAENDVALNAGRMRTLKRTAIVVMTFGVVLAVFNWALGEGVVHYEMWSTGTPLRADLANDFGLGVLFFLVVLPGSLIAASAAAWLVWRKLDTRLQR